MGARLIRCWCANFARLIHYSIWAAVSDVGESNGRQSFLGSRIEVVNLNHADSCGIAYASNNGRVSAG
jgi:hypothetical protein